MEPSVTTGSTMFFHESKPITPNQLSFRQNTSIRIIARKNDGVDTASSEPTISTLSAALPRFTAARMPNRMPNTVENSVDSTASLNVVGKRCVISYHTGLCVKIDVPRSPLSTLPSQTKYCCHIGLSRPRRIVSATRASCVAPRPRLTVTGSPGISRTITNTTMDSASSIGII